MRKAVERHPSSPRIAPPAGCGPVPYHARIPRSMLRLGRPGECRIINPLRRAVAGAPDGSDRALAYWGWYTDHGMPILEHSPWRRQYFEAAACPDDVVIPTDDDVAYALHPDHRWVYNKLLVCQTQSLRHAPHGIAPREFPVFSKPIYNLRGMGTGIRVMSSLADYERLQAPGHMWMELLSGEHVSTDVAVVAGVPVWWRHAVGLPLEGGAFDYWIVLAAPR